MYEFLYQYFTLNKKLSFPGIGEFTIEQQPAKINFSEKLLYPAESLVKFNSTSSPADKNLFQYLSHVLHTDEIQAIQKFTGYTHYLKDLLNITGTALLPGIGTLTKQSNNYSFTPQIQAQPYLSPLHAERVVRKNTTHKVKVGEDERTSTQMIELLSASVKKDRWWLYAIILAAIAIATISVYYLQRN